jgi:PAS domain S-box-containing protein
MRGYFDEKGNIVGTVESMRDITARKEKQNAIEISEVRYRRLFETAQDGILIIDGDTGQIDDVNPFLLKMVGYTREELLGKHLWEIGLFKDIAASKKAFSELQTKGYVRYEDLPLERKDGRPMDVEFVSNVYAVDHMRVIQCNIRDITERVRLQKELKAHDEHLVVISKILRHDILNNLIVITSAVRLYEEKQDKKFLEEISDRVNRSIRLINQMRGIETSLSFDRNLQPHDVAAVLKKVMEKYPSIPFTIKGNSQALIDDAFDSVIDNIIRNAIDHGKTDRIDVTVEGKDDFCEIRIADYGVGISNEMKTKIFTEGFKLALSKGSGLGLYIVGKTIERYGGTVHVEDNKPQGAVFVLRLKKKQ